MSTHGTFQSAECRDRTRRRLIQKESALYLATEDRSPVPARSGPCRQCLMLLCIFLKTDLSRIGPHLGCSDNGDADDVKLMRCDFVDWLYRIPRNKIP